jgi:glyoxylase-like metal-dependent hydrolase (beta-lactamase superfamily II)/rhodanese-related sulfurtransferase
MKIEQIYTGCLAQGAYYIESEGEVAIIDPLREVKDYIHRANLANAQIKYIFETHFHADFVSGHIDLAHKTGAEIIYGPLANPAFPSRIAHDQEVFPLGKVSITVLHTPGHTMESSCYLLKDENGNDHCIFTGDTLFLGDVGRPDLAQKNGVLTKEELAGHLYNSLVTKILPLADSVIVYPGHGAGSACGKNMMKETIDTLGNQRKVNYALLQPNKEAFIREVINGLLPPPSYFAANVAMNKNGYESLDMVLNQGMRALSVTEFQEAATLSDALILDTRPNSVFAKGFVPRAVNIGLDGQFAPWVGALIGDTTQPLLLITEEGKEEESVIRLSRVGFDNILGHLAGGFKAWEMAGQEIDVVDRVPPQVFLTAFDEKSSIVIDVRKETEFNGGHIVTAMNKPLDELNIWIHDLPSTESFYLHCAGGYRSMIAASILKSRGIHNFYEIEGGYAAIIKAKSAEN